MKAFFKNKFVFIIYIILFSFIAILLISPLKSGASTRIDNGIFSDYVLVNDGNTFEESFISNIDNLNTVGLLLPTKKFGSYNGEIEVELLVDNVFIQKANYQLNGMKDNIFTFMNFDGVRNSKGKNCSIRITFNLLENETFPIYYSKANSKSHIMINGSAMNGTIGLHLFGNNNDYFYAWYPCLAISVLFTINSLFIKKENNNV
ncbi:MAG: hypothetical protein RR342_03935 [Bacilli bacterium]